MVQIGGSGRVRWAVAGFIAAVAIALLVSFSAPPEVRLPEHPPRSDETAPTDARPLAELDTPAPPLSGRIEGRVLCARQGVAALVTLRLFPDFPEAPGHPARHGRADASGCFSFEGVPSGAHELWAAGPDGVQVRRRVTVYAGVTPKVIELLLPDGAVTLRGRAVHEDGRPFSGQVEVRRGGSVDPLFAATRSDGRFTLFGLAPGKVALRFHCGRVFFAEGAELRLPVADEVLLVVDEGAAEIGGRVIRAADGQAVAGAEVRVSGHVASGRGFTVRTWSGANGAFSARAPLDAGRVTSLAVEADGFRPWRMTRVAPRQDFEIGLTASARLTVRVVAVENGAPVPFVPVRAEYDWVPDVTGSDTLLTDSAGRVTFSSIPANTVRLAVWGCGYRTDPRTFPEEGPLVTLAPGEELEVELPALRSAILEGRVTTAAGDPREGASARYSRPGDIRSAHAGPGGRYLLPNLLPGEFSLEARLNFLRGETVTGVLAPGEVRRLDLALPAGAWLSVRVRGEDTGEPIAGARVHADGGGSKRTDAAGQARIGPVQPGTRGGFVSINGYRTAHWEGAEYVVGRPTTVVVTMSRGMSVAGRTVFPDGTPAAGATVQWANPDDPDGRQLAVCDADGRFLLRGLNEKTIRLKASQGGGHRGEASFPAGTTDALLVLSPVMSAPTRKMTLVVTDGEGRPVPKADFEVLARSAGGRQSRKRSWEIVNGCGEFEVAADSSDLLLYVHGARDPTSAPLPLGAARFGPYPATVQSIEVALPAERVIRGRVVGPDGNGLPMLRVEGSMASWPDEDVESRFPWTARTAADGTFCLGGLAEGEVYLEVLAPDGLTQADLLVVPAGEEGVVIRLYYLVSVAVTVRDPRGQPVDNATVEVWLESSLRRGPDWSYVEAWGKSDPTGVVRLSDLAQTARQVLLVSPKGEESGLGPVRIDDWLPQDTEVILPPDRPISGRILDVEGAPFPGLEGRVWCWGRVRGWEQIDPAEGGAFRVRGFAEGRVALVWFPPGSESFDPPPVEPDELDVQVLWVEAGTEGIVFRLSSR